MIKKKEFFKILTLTRSTKEKKGSDVCHFTRSDEWHYDWIRRHWGITLKPGESKEICIEEIRP